MTEDIRVDLKGNFKILFSITTWKLIYNQTGSFSAPTVKDAGHNRAERGKKIVLSHMKVKALNYTDLMEDCKDRGWCAWLFPVEVCSLKI